MSFDHCVYILMKNQQECYMDDKRKEKKKRKKKKKDKVSHITATQQLSEFGFSNKTK